MIYLKINYICSSDIEPHRKRSVRLAVLKAQTSGVKSQHAVKPVKLIKDI